MIKVAPLTHCHLGAALAAILLLPGCRGESTAAAAPSSTAAIATPSGTERQVTVDRSMLEQGRIALSEAQKRSVTDELLVTGQVIAPPHGKAEIGALLTARIRRILVEEGQIVKKGDVLATLVAPDAARISGELASARARRARAEVILTQEQRLAEQSATSARAVSEAASEAATARADEHAASVMLGTYDVSGAQLTLRTPLAGVVASSNALLGAQVDPDTILFRVIDPEQLVVRADVPESMATRIRLGSAAQLRLPTHGTNCPAAIVSSTHSVDPIKRTVSFRIKPDRACPKMLEGGFADVLIALDVTQSSSSSGRAGSAGSAAVAGAANTVPVLVAVPRSAVIELDSVPVVFVATDVVGRFRVVPLAVARHTDTTTWVERGLLGGEQVASRGALLLKGEWMKSRLE